MIQYDIDRALKKIASAWSLPQSWLESEQAGMARKSLGSIRIEYEQIEAIINGAWEGKPSGTPPLGQIFKQARSVSAAEHQDEQRPPEEERPDPVTWHTERLEWGFANYGLSFPLINQDYAIWCRRARTYGVDALDIASYTLGISREEAKAGMAERKINRDQLEQRFIESGQARRMVSEATGDRP